MFTAKDTVRYFVSRHAEEMAAATAATGRTARIVHLELAMRYSLLAAQNCQPESVAENADYNS